MNELGSFSQCLVDGDAEGLKRARQLRLKALAASMIFEGMLLAAMLLLPLITPGVLPKIYNVTPLPPYAGGGNSHPQTQIRPPHEIRDGPYYPVNQSRPTFNRNEAENTGAEPPGIDSELGSGQGPGGIGPGIGGGTGIETGDVVPLPPRPHSEKPIKISIGVMEGSLVHRVQPVYPPLAEHGRISGDVTLRATIATDGTVKDVQVLNGNPIFARAALDAVRQWRYRPTLLNGEPVEVDTFITVKFVLN
jgi:periplasmic protein TonB